MHARAGKTQRCAAPGWARGFVLMWYVPDVGAQPACWAAPRLHSCHTDARCCKKTERLNIDWKLRATGSYFYWFARSWARSVWSPWMWKASVFNMDVYYNGTFVTVTLHCFFCFFLALPLALLKLAVLLQSYTCHLTYICFVLPLLSLFVHPWMHSSSNCGGVAVQTVGTRCVVNSKETSD